MSYFSELKNGISSSVMGLKLTLRHIFAAKNSRGNFGIKDKKYFELKDGRVTLQYPHETIVVPETGRYQLDCEIDDCIVCDKCAKICPVDCIEIEAIKSPELIRTTSDGSPVRLHAAKFDIDLAKCCFCGLCTTVCPTECLTMNSEYDYSVDQVDLLNFAFAKLSVQEADEKRKLYEQFVLEKEAQKSNATAPVAPSQASNGGFKPKFKPSTPTNTDSEELKKVFVPKPKLTSETNKEVDNLEKPFAPTGSAFRPKIKEVASSKVENIAEATESGFVPKFKPSIIAEAKNNEEPLAKPAGKPIFKPKLKEAALPEKTLEYQAILIGTTATKITPEVSDPLSTEPLDKPAGKPVFKPKMKPLTDISELKTEEIVPKPASFVPKMNSVAIPNANETNKVENSEKPKFVPKLKPKE